MRASLRADLRHAWRAWSASPRVALVGVLCLGLGIGAVTTVFTAVNALLVEPIPWARPERLVFLGEASRERPAGRRVSIENLKAWDRAPGIGELAAMRPLSVRVPGGAGGRRVAAIALSPPTLDVLGVSPESGRGFSDLDREQTRGAVLISEPFWREHFGGDPDVLGRAVEVDGRRRAVVGVMPEFGHPALPAAWRSARIWLPLDDELAGGTAVTVVARLPDGVTFETGARRLEALATALSANRHGTGWRVVAEPIDEPSPATTTMLLSAVGAVTCALLIACANVAGLLLARAVDRRREMATRLALGASRARIVRQCLIESLLLGVASVPVGLLFARWGRDLFLARGLGDTGVLLPLDLTVFVFASTVALLTSLTFGMAPAVQAARLAAQSSESIGGRLTTRMTRSTGRRSLVVVEIALSLALLVGMALSVKNLTSLLAVDSHLDLDRLLTIATESPPGDGEPWHPAASRALGELRQLPGIAAVSVADFLPLRGGGARRPVSVAGDDGVGTRPTALRQAVGPAFFETLGQPLVRGRSFDESEVDRREPVAVVNERLARMLWPAADPVGQRIRFVSGGDDAWLTVLGVAHDLSNWDVSGVPLPAVYVPITRGAAEAPTFVVRASGPPRDVSQSIADHLASAGVEVGSRGPLMLSEARRMAFVRQEGLARLFRVLGGLSIALTFVGLFALLSYQVSQRTAEIGIRMALGASRARVLWFVMRQAAVLSAAGLVVGVPVAFVTARVLGRVLYQVDAFDPLVLAPVAVVIAGVVILAGWVPAWRAASIDPATALR